MKIAESEVKIGPLAGSSWINLQKISFFVSFFLKKRNSIEKDIASKLHCNPGFGLSLILY
jgi:hypothetical protein